MLAGMPTQLRHLAAAVAALEAATSDQYLDVNGAVDVSAIMNAFGSNRPVGSMPPNLAYSCCTTRYQQSAPSIGHGLP